MNTYEELAEKAEDMEACEFDFLDCTGKVATNGSTISTFEVEFIDGVTMKCPFDLAKFGPMVFKLRPKEDH